MTKKLKNIISLFLVFIFLAPVTIKLLDSSFHYHDHFICTAHNEHRFHEYHHKCPIPGFEFSLYSLNKIIPEKQKPIYGDKLFANYISNHYCDRSKYSFLLRAPPLNIHN